VILIPALATPHSQYEPPCRQRRLEPFRQHIRDSCIELPACTRSPTRPLDEALSSAPPDVRSVLDEFLSPSFTSQSFDATFDDMMGRSLRLFDAMLAVDGLSSSLAARQHAERATEQALDVMVASLFSNLHGDQVKQRDIADQLSSMGSNLMTHRRLSESNDGHAEIQQRLARRLTEYSLDVFYNPESNTVAMYTSAFDQDDHPVLGLGSDLDLCVYSRYMNGDLEPTCQEALDMFLTAQQTPGLTYPDIDPARNYAGKRTSDPQTLDIIARAIEQHEYEQVESPSMNDNYYALVILFSIYAIVAFVGLCSGLANVWTITLAVMLSVSVAVWGWISLVVALPMLLVANCWIPREEDEEECHDDATECDYVQLLDDENEVKQAETLVFVGVPVQVV